MSETNIQEQLLATLIADATKGISSSDGRLDPIQLIMRSVPQFMEGMSQRRQEMLEMRAELRRTTAGLKVLHRMLKQQEEKLARVQSMHSQLKLLTEAVSSLSAIFEGSHWELDDAPYERPGMDPEVCAPQTRERNVNRGTAPEHLRSSERYMMNHRRNAER